MKQPIKKDNINRNNKIFFIEILNTPVDPEEFIIDMFKKIECQEIENILIELDNKVTGDIQLEALSLIMSAYRKIKNENRI